MSQSSDIADTGTAEAAGDHELVLSEIRRLGDDARPRDHHVQFYEDEEALTERVAAFVAEGLLGRDWIVVIGTREHNVALEGRLVAACFDVAAARSSGRLRFLDAHETLADFMRDGEPDAALFGATVGQVIAQQAAAASGARLRAYGEMVDVLWKQGQRGAAIRLEELWNELQQRHTFRLLCAYAMGNFYKEPGDVERVCAAHSHVIRGKGAPVLVDETVPHSADGSEPTRRLAREIAHREEVESALRESLRELRLKGDALRESERQLRVVTDSLPVLVSYVDTEQRYRFVSAAYERWFARPKAEILDKRLDQVLGDAYEAIRPHAEQALAGATAKYEAEIGFGDGTTRSVEGTYVPHVSGDGQVEGFVGLVHDVTERKRFERFRLAAAARAERTSRIIGAIADAVSAPQVFEALVDRVYEAVDATSAALWIIDEDAGTAELVRAVGYADAARRSLQSLPLDLTPSIPAIDSMRRGEAIWIDSQAELIRRYPHLRSIATPGRSYRVSCLPLAAHGRVLGTLCLTIENASETLEDEREVLLLVARYASQAVERLRLFASERRSRSEADRSALRMGLLSHASRVFAEADPDLESRLRAVVREVGRATESGVGITLIGPDGLLHTSAAFHPIAEAEQLLIATGRRAPLRRDEGVTARVLATGKSVLIPSIAPEELAAHAAPAYRSFLERYPAYAMICAPLRAQEQIIGVLIATRTRAGETYTTDDLQVLEQLAERAAVAIENSRLYLETVQARNRAEQLYRFAQAVVVADKIETVFEAALGAIEAALGVRRAAILTFDDAGVLRFVGWRNLSDGYRRAVEGHSPWSRDAGAPEPLLVSDAASDPSVAPYRQLFESEGIGALAFIPLVTRGRLLGKFMVYYDGRHAFSSHEVETATAIGNHLASVVTRFYAVTRLEETLKANELFSGVLAHDLRNPLAAMTTAAQILLARYDSEGRTSDDIKPLNRILSSGNRMSRLIDQLLDFTRARTGGIELEPRDADLGELCAQAIEEIELAHPSWTIHCEITGDGAGRWDPDRLLQVISNLVANAGQHGAGDRTITVKVDGARPDDVTFDVHNWGTVPSSLLPDIFEPFRTTRPGSRSSGGLGLGLFIVRELVRAHGGSVTVASSEDNGTTFSFQLPRHARSTKSGPSGR